MNRFQRLTRNLVFQRLRKLTEGRLVIRERERVHAFGDDGNCNAAIQVLDPRFYTAVAFGGHIGAAEAYANGWWDAADLTAVIRLFVRNRSAMNGLERGAARLIQPLRSLAHALHQNTRPGSRRNIEAHYDLGNDFFELFLDETLTYSSAYFERPDAKLADASRAKYDRICKKIELRPSDHVIEIGSGWGGFAIHAAKHYGCRVTTTTISREQYRLATQRIRDARLTQRVRVLLSDYRDLAGQYDKLVSIEMIEAVGHQFYDTYFAKCAELLTPSGLAAIQAITIQDRLYQEARRHVDFIKRYIFPGGCIPALAPLLQACSGTDLRLVHAEDFGVHYAHTLREWDRNFRRNRAAIAARGYDERFQRLWQFYFAYCAGGFEEGVIGVSQLVFAKPRAALEMRSISFASQVSAA
jgi:cyclopropane-fatty-acyl-phospholipid synthase